MKETFVDSGVEEGKVVVTPYPTDLSRFAPAPRADDGVFRVLFVGQLTQRKGLSYLVEGFQRAAIPRRASFCSWEVRSVARPPWSGPAPASASSTG